MPRFQDIVTDNEGNGLPGAIVTVRDYPSGNLSTLTADSGGSLTNPIVADANGAYYFNAANAIYSLEFRLLAYEPAREVRLVNLGNLVDSQTLAATTGAALVGTPNGGTIASKLFGTDLGAIPDGVGNDLVVSRRFSGVGSSSGLYGENNQITGYGSLDIGSIRAVYFGTALETTAGTTALAESGHFFVWVRGAGSVTEAKVVEAHLVCGRDANGISTTGTITSDAIYFNTAGITLGAVTVPQVTGFNCGQLTDTSSGGVVTTTIGFNAEHNQGAAGTRGFRSQVRKTGTNHYSFLADTNDTSETAPAAFSGKVSIGGNSQGSAFNPAWTLDLISAADDYSARIANRTGGAPFGLRVEFTALAPRNRTSKFATFLDTSSELAAIYSNGDIDTVGKVRSTSASGGIGYGTGAGAPATQLTSKTTGVTTNAPCGQITTANSAIAANASAIFTLTNSQIAATDLVIVNLATGNINYRVDVDAVAAGSCRIRIWNLTAGSLSDVLTINFAVIKAVAA